MSGPKSWGISLLIGFGGVALGYLIFTVGLGIGDTPRCSIGGIIGAIIILVIVGFVARRSQHKSPPASPTAPTTPTP